MAATVGGIRRKNSLPAGLHWVERDQGLVPVMVDNLGKEREVTWAAQPGSQEAFLQCPVFEALIEGTRGGGKGLVHGEPVQTPLGPRNIEDIKRGQWVLTHDGGRARVIGVYPQGERESYEIEFDDGAIARCDDVHIWPIHIQGETTKRADYDWVNMAMEDVLSKFRSGKRLHVPTCAPAEFQRAPRREEWPVEPYLLGLLLGDGCMSKKDLFYCSIDRELYEHAELHEMHGSIDDRGLWTGRANRDTAVYGGVRRLGLLGHRAESKFVPRMYLNADTPTRLAVLQGIMDTDGTVDAEGRVSFGSTSRQLSEDVQHLVRSLGGKATLFRKNTTHQDAWVVCIQCGSKFLPFRLKRKVDRCRPYQHRVLWRRIVDIRPLGRRESTCIKISHPMGLFMTRDFVVTHNTDTLLMDFTQHVGQGFGAEWRGILFRRTYPELEDVIAKSKKWFGVIFPNAKYNEAKSVWTWPTGESLRFRHFKHPDDYWSYHGHAYPWIAWEELTTWATDECFKTMFSCARSPVKGIPIKVRSTTNPYGVGHHWVKERYRLPIHGNRIVGRVIRDAVDEGGNEEPPRVAIHSDIRENRVLLTADPDYIKRISAAARNESERRAWLYGSWDIVSGGMFDDVWIPERHVLPDLVGCIPATWRIDRSFDWGSSKPFSVGWWAESDGSDLLLPDGSYMSTVRGDLIRVAEWYGWTGKPNKGLYMTAAEIADGIRRRERELFPGRRVYGGPADSSIFDVQDGNSIASNMARLGVNWTRADKSAGSRKNGWERMRMLLKNVLSDPASGPREEAGMFVTERCDQWLRTVPTLPRDDRDLDDVDTDAEDHAGDETRYRVYRGSGKLNVRSRRA